MISPKVAALKKIRLAESVVLPLMMQVKDLPRLLLLDKSAHLSILLFFSFLYTARAQYWQVLGSEQQVASGASNFTTIATVTEDVNTVPYVVFTESNIAKVKKYTEGTWQQAGGNISDGNATYTRIYTDLNYSIFVTYVDAATGRLAVKTLDTLTAEWKPLNGNTGNLYVSAGSVTYNTGQYGSTPRSGMAFDTSNVPYIIYADGAGLNPYVKRFNGTAWETVGSGAVSAERAVGVNLAIDSTSNFPFIVYVNQASATSTTGNIAVYRFTGSVWQQVAVPSPVSGGNATTGATTAIRHTSIAFDSSWNPVVSYFNAGNSNRATIITYNKAAAAWSYGGTVSTRDASNNAISRDRSGNLYATYTDAISNGSGRSVARVMKLAAGSSTWVELKDTIRTEGVDEPAGNFSIAIGENTSKPYVVYTKTNSNSVTTPVVRVFTPSAPPPPPPVLPDSVVTTRRQMEYLNRGLIAVRTGTNQVYIGWRFSGADSAGTSFNVYRDGILVNSTPVTNSTNLTDNTAINGTYTLRAVVNGEMQPPTDPVSVWGQNYLNLPLQVPAGGTTPAGEAYTYSPNDCSVGDVDGDGEYEIIVKWDPSNSKDNSQAGYTGNVYLDAYKLNGTRLWRIDLGRNIRAGAHYTQFMVYDLDGDGKAEVACKTADATIDGAGTVIGNANADYRNTGGYILTGPEYLTIFNGLTGAAMATANYLPVRGSVASWGDNYGNRVDRFIAAVAYMDGARPSLVMGRGYYTRLVRAAWDWRNGQLTSRWVFDSNVAGNGAYAGQGNHQMSVGDADGDGKDEVFNGSSAINDNGKGLWANGMGHGDAHHLTDIDPDRPGLETWEPYEDPANNGMIGAALCDAKTGDRIFTVPLATAADVGRGLSANIDPRYKGNEMWAARGDLYTAKGERIGATKPSMNFAIWWDADTTRELLDNITITKWNYVTNTNTTIFTATGCASNNSTKATPNLSADIFGDWREEVILRTSDNSNLRIFTTTALTASRFYTLMHDPQYRVAIAWQNSAYNQPPHPGVYLGEGMNTLAAPNIYLASGTALPVKLLKFTAIENRTRVDISWKTANEKNNDRFIIERSADGLHFTAIYTTKGIGNSTLEHTYSAVDASPNKGINYYRLKQIDEDGRSSYSSVQMVNITGLAGKLSIRPNPVFNEVHLELSSPSANLQLLVISPDGRLIRNMSGNLSQLNMQMNSMLPGLDAGLYMLQVTDGSVVHTLKMVKKD